MTGQGFAVTLANYHAAGNLHGVTAEKAADALPMSPWGESARRMFADKPNGEAYTMTPQTVAMNWRANVSDTAHNLAQLIHAQENGGTKGTKKAIRKAARALLAALGED